MTLPCWLRRAVRNRHRHAVEQASHRWRGGRRADSARTRRKILISTQAATMRNTSPTQWKSSAHHATTTPTVPSSPPASASKASSRLAQPPAQHGSASAPLIASTRATSARCARRASSAAAVHQRARTSTHRDMACVLPAAACLSSSCNSCRYLIASMADGVQRSICDVSGSLNGGAPLVGRFPGGSLSRAG